MIPGRPVTRRASLRAPSIASEPELRKSTESSGAGNVAARSVASREIGSVKPIALIGPMSLSTCAWIAARDPRMGVAQRRDRDAVREVEVRLAVGVVQPVALAVAPLALEVAAEDGRQVGGDVHRPECIGHGNRAVVAPVAAA